MLRGCGQRCRHLVRGSGVGSDRLFIRRVIERVIGRVVASRRPGCWR
jgi:hypothetical protein